MHLFMIRLVFAVIYTLAFVTVVATDVPKTVATCTVGEVEERGEAETEVQEEADVSACHIELLQSKMRQTIAAARVVKDPASVFATVGIAVTQDGQATDDSVTIAHANNEMAAKKRAVNTDVPLINFDENGHMCMFCGLPFPERSNRNYTEFREDCGGLSSESGPIASVLDVPVVELRENAENEGGADKNGFCLLNFAKSCADAVANEDYLYFPKGFDLNSKDVRSHAAWDGRYCRLNGFLEADIVALQHDFEGMRAKASELCEEKYEEYDIGELTFMDLMANTRYDDPLAPELEEAGIVAAWNCAMGDLGCEMAFCAYSYCISGNKTGLYDECDGWDPVLGMPIPYFTPDE